MTNIDKAQSVARNKRIKDHLARAVRYEGIIMTYEEMSKKLISEGYAPVHLTQAYQAVSPNGTLVDISKIQHDYMVKLIW